MKNFTKIAAATTVLAASLISSVAMAETVTDNVDAYAGLQPALEMSCTAVSFGVWRVPVRTGGDTTTITMLTTTDTPELGGTNLARVAQSKTDTWPATRGKCTVSGSTAADLIVPTISFTTPAAAVDMAMSGAGPVDTGYTDLVSAEVPALLTATLELSETPGAFDGGSATFYIGGVLTIPGTIEADNYGGYKTTTAAEVTANDET